jgi:phosphoserine phosphatase
MKMISFGLLLGLVLSVAQAADPLPSWNDGPTKAGLISFITDAETEGSKGFIPPAERIAVFDNDGTLWSEKPMYFQLLFAVDRLRALAEDDPSLASTEPFRAVLEADRETLHTYGMKEVAEIIMRTHAGLTEEEFAGVVRDWIDQATHPQTGMKYTDMTFRPMKELLDALRGAGFKTYIVSGGGLSFMRPWVEDVYGIPPEQVVGSRVKVEYQVRDDGPALVRLPEIDLVDDKAGKPVGIYQAIGRRPVFAAGNSDGDFQMLEYATTGKGPRFGLLVHHTDDEREYAYDRDSHVGRLDRGLDEAEERGWMIVDMARDWGAVYGHAD